VTPPLGSPRFVPAAASILLWCAAGAFLAVWFSGRIRDWSVMTDELQYVKLALAVAETGSPLPSLHDTSVSIANQLYPLLLAPVYGSLSSPDAFRAAHVLNAFLMTSAVFPAYLLGRELLTRAWSFAVAVLVVAVPWIVLTGFVMSEVVAYPAFLWAVLAFQRTIVDPSPRRDLFAVVALGVAILARTQFLALALVVPVAILFHELGQELALDGAAGLRRRLGTGVREAVGRHRTLWALYAAGAIVVTGVLLAGSNVLGSYQTTVEGGSILPARVWWSVVEHLAVVGIGCGILPLVLGGGWMLAGVVRPSSPRRRGFATLAILTVAVLAVETASYDLRFGGQEVVRDRYLFYVVPLFFVASAAALTEKRTGAVAVGAMTVTTAVAAAAHGLPFPTSQRISVDSPVSVFNETLIQQSGSLGTGMFVALVIAVLGLALVPALLFAPRAPLALVLFIATLVFSSLVLRDEADRMLDGTGLSGRPLAEPPDAVVDWVDSVVPEGQTAAVVPFPISAKWGESAIRWWDVEFWNRRITLAYAAPDGNFSYAPFPVRTLAVDPLTGTVEGTSNAPGYVVVAPEDPRFGLAGRERSGRSGLRLVEVERPYRAAWSSRGLQSDGWTTPGRGASIRVYGWPGAPREVKRVRVVLTPPTDAGAEYRVETETAERSRIISAGTTVKETVFVCVGPRAPVDVVFTASTSAIIEGPPLRPEPGPPRRVGVKIGPIAVDSTGRPCGGA
jgi:hypothetical protein